MRRVTLLLTLLTVLVLLSLSFAGSALAIDPPDNLFVRSWPINGTTTITLDWDAPAGAVSYKIYRSSSRITDENKGAPIDTGVTETTYEDSVTKEDVVYYYQVTAVDGSSNESLVSVNTSKDYASALAGENAHDGYSSFSNLCRDCHRVHEAKGKKIIRSSTEIEICYVCHDGSGSTYNIRTTYEYVEGVQDGSAHDTQLTAPTESNIKCLKCHHPHGAASWPSGGDWSTRASEESLCFTDGCHDNATHTETTTILSWNIYNQFQQSSHHAITGTTGDGLTGAVVECSSCHGPHTVEYSSTTLEKVSDPDNTYDLASTAGITENTTFCLRCHDGTPPSQTWGSSTTYVPYSIAFPTVSSYPFFAGWSKSNYTSAVHYTGQTGDDKQCTNCHEVHGSDYARLTKGNEENLCYVCHDAGGGGGTTLFEDDFESGSLDTESWDVVNNGGYVGLDTGIPNEGHGGSYWVMYYGDGAGNDTKTITTPGINVTGYTTLTLTYWYSIEDLEAGDGGYLDVYDGSWHTAVKGPYVDDNSRHATSSGDYIQETVDLSSYNKVTDFKLRFGCDAIHAEESDKWLLDDVVFTGSTAAAIPDIGSLFDNTYKHPTETYSGRHEDTEVAGDLGSTNRHAECVDCHNVHRAEDGTHTAESSVAGVALKGTTGVKPNTWPSDGDYSGTSVSWPSAPSSWTTVLLDGDTGDYEAYLCFKCHTNYATGYPTSGYTNLALEFNPNNPSYHSVLGQTTAGQLGTYVSPWDYQSDMTCSDCHTNNSDSNPQGPHGSTNEHILKAPYDANTGVQGHSDSGDLCFKCHSYNTYGQNAQQGASTGFTEWDDTSRNLHEKSDHAEEGCYMCHSAVPHGYLHRALNIDKDEATPYNGTGGTGMNVLTWPSSQRDWDKNDCDGTTCGNH